MNSPAVQLFSLFERAPESRSALEAIHTRQDRISQEVLFGGGGMIEVAGDSRGAVGGFDCSYQAATFSTSDSIVSHSPRLAARTKKKVLRGGHFLSGRPPKSRVAT
jgi:hypothetical protein